MTEPDAPGTEETPAADPAIELAAHRLITARRIHTLYPPNSPNVRAALTKLREAVMALPAGEPFQVTVERERLLHGDIPILADLADAQPFAQQLYLTSVKSIIIEQEASEDELIVLLDEIRVGDAGEGSIDQRIQARGVYSITVNEAGQVKVEISSGGSENAWDTTSLARLESLEKEVFGGDQSGFTQTFRSVGEGEDPKTARLTGLLARPVEFATLLLDVASHERIDGRVDLDHQFSVLLRLVSELEPMIENLAPIDRISMYAKLRDVVQAITITIHREILDVSLPPYVRLGSVERLFPDKIRMLTVKEALSLGLGHGLMPFLMGALRRIAAGDHHLLEFLSGGDPNVPPRLENTDLSEYRPAPLSPAPPSPPVLSPPFFEPAPGGAPHPGEIALSGAITRAHGAFDSFSTILDILAIENDRSDYRLLLDQLVARFTLGLRMGNLEFAMKVLDALDQERSQNAIPDLGRPEFADLVDAALAKCGSKDVMRSFTDAITEMPSGSPELKRACTTVETLGGAAIESLLHVLADEPVISTRRKLLEVLSTAGKQHVDLIAAFGSHDLWYVVRNVILILGEIGEANLPRIVQIATHPEPRVRREAIRAVGRFKSPEATATLLRWLTDPDEAVFRDALAKLVVMNERRCLSPVHKFIRKPGFTELDKRTVVAVAKTFGTLGNRDSGKLIAALLGSPPSGWLRAPDVRKLYEDAGKAVADRLKES